ncbi:hypothetical protein [Massilia sp. YIM B04103]|uniref:hypothetical protein n=1 Tax=Massilia sp. YIM B04103 TaxID=2963106 RepID=UPI002109BF4E|nr:hypothetical protein [Massilia sp. YIM B04103]
MKKYAFTLLLALMAVNIHCQAIEKKEEALKTKQISLKEKGGLLRNDIKLEAKRVENLPMSEVSKVMRRIFLKHIPIDIDFDSAEQVLRNAGFAISLMGKQLNVSKKEDAVYLSATLFKITESGFILKAPLNLYAQLYPKQEGVFNSMSRIEIFVDSPLP